MHVARSAGNTPPPPSPPRAAVCLSGQVRTLNLTASTLSEHLSYGLGGRANVDYFLFVNLDDGDGKRYSEINFNSQRSGSELHTLESLHDAIAALKPVTMSTYTTEDYVAAAPARHGRCIGRQQVQPSDFSLHGIQFWGLQRCLGMVRSHERATGFRYEWIVRARPDDAWSWRGGHDLKCLRQSFQQRTLKGQAKNRSVWLSGDHFFFGTREALPAMESVWGRYAGDACVPLLRAAPEAARDATKSWRSWLRSCSIVERTKDGEQLPLSTDCFLQRHLTVGGVQVHLFASSSPLRIRPKPRHATAGLLHRRPMIREPQSRLPAAFVFGGREEAATEAPPQHEDQSDGSDSLPSTKFVCHPDGRFGLAED